MRLNSTNTGAKGLVSGTVSNGATWSETFEISQNNLQITGADTSTWQFVFKHGDGGNICLTLVNPTQITVTQNTISTLFTINCPAGNLTNMVGDYIADFAQKDASGNVTHWLSGTVTFINENLGF